MNIQYPKLGKITDQRRDRSTQLIRVKLSEHNHTRNKRSWVERVSYDITMLAGLKATMYIQGLKLGKITDRRRDRSTQLIIIKPSEHNHTQKREVWVERVNFDVTLLAELKTRMYIQGLKLG